MSCSCWRIQRVSPIACTLPSGAAILLCESSSPCSDSTRSRALRTLLSSDASQPRLSANASGAQINIARNA